MDRREEIQQLQGRGGELIHIHIGLPGDALSGLEGLMLFIQPQRVRHALIAELISEDDVSGRSRLPTK